jgi:hypothetical protein
VQCSFDGATFRIGGQRDPFPGSSELLDLTMQSIEGWLLVDLLDLQRMPSRAGIADDNRILWALEDLNL